MRGSKPKAQTSEVNISTPELDQHQLGTEGNPNWEVAQVVPTEVSVEESTKEVALKDSLHQPVVQKVPAHERPTVGWHCNIQ